MKFRRILLPLAWFVLVIPTLALAQSIPSLTDLPTGYRPDSWHVWNATALGVNQLVGGDQLKVYRKMPWGQGKTLLTSDSHWRYGANCVFSPAINRPALMIGVSPLLILDVDLHYGPGINTTNYDIDSYKQKYDPQNMGEASGYFGIFHQTQANVTFKIGAGPVAVLSMNDFDYFYADDYFFNWDVATIVKDGFFRRNKVFFLVEFMRDWRVFLNYENFENLAPGSDFMSELASSGFIIMYPKWNSLMWIFQLGYHVHNPDFEGLKAWTAMTMEWDFPDKK